MSFKASNLVLFFTILTNLIFPQQNQPEKNKIVVGYYAGWAMYARDYNVSDILDVADKYTHINYAFFGIDWDQATETAALMSTDEHQDYEHSEDHVNTSDDSWKLPGYYGDGEAKRGNIGALGILKSKIEEAGGSIKIILSVGGWTLSQPFPLLAASQNGRETFAQSCADWLIKYNHFDGIDLDWEFPFKGGYDGFEIVNGKTYDVQPHNTNDALNFLLLLKEIRETFDANNLQEKEISVALGNNRQILSSQVIGNGNKENYGRTDHIFDYLNFATFFGYDLGGAWEDRTCHNAPLYPSGNEEDPLFGKGRSWSLDGLLDEFTAIVGEEYINQIYVGIPFYGRMFGNVNSQQENSEYPGLFSDAPRSQLPSKCTKGVAAAPPGTWDPNEDIEGSPHSFECERTGAIEYLDLIGGEGLTEIRYPHHFLKKEKQDEVNLEARKAGWVRYWDDTSKVPYLYNDITNEFISYDDPTSLQLKVDRILSRGFGGLMVWEISQDLRDVSTDEDGLIDITEEAIESLKVDITLNFKDTNENYLENVKVVLKDENDTVVSEVTSNDKGIVMLKDIEAYKPYKIEMSLSNYTFSIGSGTTKLITLEKDELSSDKTINVKAQKLLEISTHNNINNIKLFPIPFRNTINILSDVKITSTRVKSMQGSILLTFNYKNDENPSSIDLNQLNSGAYILEIKSDDKTTSRIVLKK